MGFRQLTLKLSCPVIHFNFSWWTFPASSGIPKQHLHSLACPLWHNCYSCICVRLINKFQLSFKDEMDKILIMSYSSCTYLPRTVIKNIIFTVINAYNIFGFAYLCTEQLKRKFKVVQYSALNWLNRWKLSFKW